MIEVSRSVPGVERGCGYRTEGGVYLESGLAPGGVPLEHFILDPPIILDIDCKTGVQLWEHPGTKVTHIIDWIGTKHYPYAPDVIEEGRKYGFSRRVTKNIRWEDLDDRSRIILVHEKAILENRSKFCFELEVQKAEHESLCALYQREALKVQGELFDKAKVHIRKPCDYDCNAYQYTSAKANAVRLVRFDGSATRMDHLTSDVTPALVAIELDRMTWELGAAWRKGIKAVEYYRQIGSTRYRIYPNWALERNDQDWAFPVFKAAAIAAMPITNVSVIRAADNEKHNDTFAHIQARLSPLLNVEVNDA